MPLKYKAAALVSYGKTARNIMLREIKSSVKLSESIRKQEET
jgi:hypothetical protein